LYVQASLAAWVKEIISDDDEDDDEEEDEDDDAGGVAGTGEGSTDGSAEDVVTDAEDCMTKGRNKAVAQSMHAATANPQ